MREISEAQRLAIWSCCATAAISDFDADEVADDLLAHADLWLACWWGDHDDAHPCPRGASQRQVYHPPSTRLSTSSPQQDRWETARPSWRRHWGYDRD
jgi:hypothetical protein